MEITIHEDRLNMSSFQTVRILSGFEPLESGMLRRALAGSAIKLMADADGLPVGMLRVVGDGSFVFVIADVMVIPDYRNRGVATALIKRSLEIIKTFLPMGMSAAVTLFAAPGKESLYRKAGFYPVPNREIGKGMVAYVYNL